MGAHEFFKRARSSPRSFFVLCIGFFLAFLFIFAIQDNFASPEMISRSNFPINESRYPIVLKNLQYYNHPDSHLEKNKPINHERFLVWGPWEAGFNNRRMTFEIFYV
jgi:hypothetical protein